MPRTYFNWTIIGGMVSSQNDFYIVDRLALRPGCTNIRSLKRYQIIDESQRVFGTFRDLSDAQYALDELCLTPAQLLERMRRANLLRQQKLTLVG